MKRSRSRVNGKNGKCLTCPCHQAGVVRPACRAGVYGLPTPDGWLFPPLPCAFDAARVLAAPPCHGPKHQGRHSQGRRCSDCPALISNNSGGRCKACAAARRKGVSFTGGRANPAWGYRAARGRGKAKNARASRVR